LAARSKSIITAVGDPRPVPMKSPVYWALLGLIIERESYAYELAQRFHGSYGDALPLSSTSHIYTALSVLEGRSFVEQTPGTRVGRQPKPGYRATPDGIEAYGEWLVDYVREDRRRQALFVLGLSATAGDPRWFAEILRRCEQAWLAQKDETALFGAGGAPGGPGRELVARLLFEENELSVAAKLSWVRKALQALEDVASGGAA
jgi:DNA-binding PadR family transcriptional regulator